MFSVLNFALALVYRAGVVPRGLLRLGILEGSDRLSTFATFFRSLASVSLIFCISQIIADIRAFSINSSARRTVWSLVPVYILGGGVAVLSLVVFIALHITLTRYFQYLSGNGRIYDLVDSTPFIILSGVAEIFLLIAAIYVWIITSVYTARSKKSIAGHLSKVS
jgi:hypothetical protein